MHNDVSDVSDISTTATAQQWVFCNHEIYWIFIHLKTFHFLQKEIKNCLSHNCLFSESLVGIFFPNSFFWIVFEKLFISWNDSFKRTFFRIYKISFSIKWASRFDKTEAPSFDWQDHTIGDKRRVLGALIWWWCEC